MQIDPSLPPFAPPYKTIDRTEAGVSITETLADGSTRALSEAEISQIEAAAEAAARPAADAPGPVKTTTFGNSKIAMYLKVPFADKDQAKALGARWDAAKKKWYVPQGKDIDAFRDWWPDAN